MEIPRGRGVLKVKIFEAKHEAKLEFPGETGGAKQKNLPWEEYGYILELHIANTPINLHNDVLKHRLDAMF